MMERWFKKAAADIHVVGEHEKWPKFEHPPQNIYLKATCMQRTDIKMKSELS